MLVYGVWLASDSRRVYAEGLGEWQKMMDASEYDAAKVEGRPARCILQINAYAIRWLERTYVISGGL